MSKQLHFQTCSLSVGVVGGDRQKNCLFFVSLSRKIDSGVKAGYHESEIVVRAVSPSLKLRSYPEMMDNLSLIRLKQILGAHFKEKTGPELYEELTSLCHDQKESAQVGANRLYSPYRNTTVLSNMASLRGRHYLYMLWRQFNRNLFDPSYYLASLKEAPQ